MLTCLCYKCLAEPLLLPGLAVKGAHLLPAQLRNFTETYQGFALCEMSLHFTAPVSSGHQKSINTELTLWVHLLKLFLPQPVTLSLLKKHATSDSLSQERREGPAISTTRVSEVS